MFHENSDVLPLAPYWTVLSHTYLMRELLTMGKEILPDESSNKKSGTEQFNPEEHYAPSDGEPPEEPPLQWKRPSKRR